MVCLHATDPTTIGLSAWARVEGMTAADLERAMYVERSLVKHMAMRRTLFVFPREEIPLLEGSLVAGEGKPWGGSVPVGPRVLTVLSAEGLIVRASNDGAWTASRPRWTATSAWLGAELSPGSAQAGTAVLVEQWLRAFGPGTAANLKWWLGSTVGAVRRALEDVRALEVDLDGEVGYVLPDDLDPVGPVDPWAALLPSLDPTPMGWFSRDWYLGPHKPHVFDRNGNVGATAWWDGRIVGGWRQGAAGEVELQLLEDVGTEAVGALEGKAERLSAWLGETLVQPRYPSPLSKVA